MHKKVNFLFVFLLVLLAQRELCQADDADQSSVYIYSNPDYQAGKLQRVYKTLINIKSKSYRSLEKFFTKIYLSAAEHFELFKNYFMSTRFYLPLKKLLNKFGLDFTKAGMLFGLFNFSILAAFIISRSFFLSFPLVLYLAYKSYISAVNLIFTKEVEKRYFNLPAKNQLYSIYGLPSHATKEEIDERYQELVENCNGDNFEYTTEDTRLLIEKIYDVLSNPIKKWHYDVTGDFDLNILPLLEPAKFLFIQGKPLIADENKLREATRVHYIKDKEAIPLRMSASQ